jgi:pimeloyl-ACP methyl ester carboxylesterase
MTLLFETPETSTVASRCHELNVPGPAGTLLHVRLWGDLVHATSTIVAVHGIYQSGKCWEHQAALATPGTVLIAVDLPFHGDTYTPASLTLHPDLMAQSIQAIMDYFHLEKMACFLMGWSFGAWCVGSYLQRYGTKSIQGVILVSGLFGDISQCLSLAHEEHRDALDSMSILTDPTATLTSFLVATQQFVTLLRHNSVQLDTTEEYTTELGYNVRAVIRLRSASINPMLVVAQNPLEGVYAQLNQASVPVYMLTGAQDALLPLEWFYLIASQLPHAETYEHAHCGHSFFAEYPEHFNDAVRAFMHKQTTHAKA